MNARMACRVHWVTKTLKALSLGKGVDVRARPLETKAIFTLPPDPSSRGRGSIHSCKCPGHRPFNQGSF